MNSVARCCGKWSHNDGGLVKDWVLGGLGAWQPEVALGPHPEAVINQR